MLRPTQETPAEVNMTMKSLSPEQARFRDWLTEGSARLNDNVYRDKPKPRQLQFNSSELRVTASGSNILVKLCLRDAPST